MSLKSVPLGVHILIRFSFCVVILILLSDLQSAIAIECPYSNFIVIDGNCINLDSQMKPKKTTHKKIAKIANPQSELSELNELGSSSLATYASLLSLVAGGTLGYKFLLRK